MAVIKVRFTVSELANVMTQFDQVQVHRSTTGISGVYSEITGPGTRVTLIANHPDYFYDDTSGDSSYYYKTRYYNSSTLAVSTFSDPIKGDVVFGGDFLTIDDLYAKIGERRVEEMFDDNNDADLGESAEMEAYVTVMREAEGIAYSYMLRAYTDTETIIDLANADEVFKGMVAWIALELASERRVFVQAPDGKGEFWAQYERSIDYLNRLSKGRRRSKGEATAGTSGNVGGTLQPSVAAGASRFLIAPEKNADGSVRRKGSF
jgi:hypothetical protein